MKKVPITTDFNSTDLIGSAKFTEEGIKKLYQLIEAGTVPMFGIGFVGEPDENGVYHNAELMEVSMLTMSQGKE